MLAEIFRFEIRNQLRQPIFAIAVAIFFLLTFGAVTTDAVQIGGSIGSVNRNAPYVIMQILLVMSVIGVFVTTAFVASAVQRDFEHNTHEIFFSTSMTKRDYLLGRFGGALAVAVAVFGGVVLGILIGSVMPWLEPERIGPTTAAPYILSLAVLVLPNIFLTAGIFFSLATLTRSMLWTFAGVIAFFAGYFVAASFLGDLENQFLAALLDPFGFAAFEFATKYWTVAEKNTALLPLDRALVYNRLIWCGVALAVLALTFVRFRFTVAGAGRSWSRKAAPQAAAGDRAVEGRTAAGRAADGHTAHGRAADSRDVSMAHLAARSRSAFQDGRTAGLDAGAGSGRKGTDAGVSTARDDLDPGLVRQSARARGARLALARAFSARVLLQQYWHQSRLEIAGILRGAPFLVILAFGMLNVIGSASEIEQLFGTPVHPVTHMLLRVISGAFGLTVILILTFYSGELTWRERTLKLDGVFDALPAPTWVFWASKLSALIASLAVLLGAAMLTGIGIQLYHGYFHVEPRLYIVGLFLVIGVPFALAAVLALFVQALTNHKYLGFLVMVLVYISNPVLTALHFEHNLYRFGDAPDAPYSDMNGYGHFVKPLFWFYLYWSLFAVVLAVLTHLLWVRGSETRLGLRLRLARQRFSARPRAVLAGAALAFLGTGAFIFYNTNILNPYRPEYRLEARQAEYEKKYKKYESLPGLRIAAVRADVDIDPAQRALSIRGTYTLVNKTAVPVAAVHLALNPNVQVRSLAVRGSRVEMEDKDLGYSIRHLDEPLAPGGETELTFDLAVTSQGFVNNAAATFVVENGTFFNSFEVFPHLGYWRDGEIQDPNRRRKHGLPPVVRMPKLEDEKARQNNYASMEADWIRFETTVSTSPDQIAVAPGYLQKEWVANGRRYFHYKMDAPILDFWAYLSARYAVKRDRWKDVAIEVYYHPSHAYNVDRMIDAVKKSLDYFTTNFGPYQHRQVRILEFPRYARFAQSFPNTIPFSESIGFIARLEKDDDIDYVFYVTAHEVAHQWWAHQVIGGNVQGATMLSETMAQYSALMVMEKEYGREKMRRFLKYELEGYLRGRGGERIEELPLLRVEDQPYVHYRKGSLVMYALRDYIGEAPLNRALASYVKAKAFQEPPYTTSRELLAYIRREIPSEQSQIVEDLFETITLYENRAQEATYERRADGKYAVRLVLGSQKFRASGAGVESAVPVDDWMDVAVFGKKERGGSPEGKILALEKRHITGAATTVELVVDEQPVKAGIDPFNKLLDRSPENNLVGVGEKAGRG